MTKLYAHWKKLQHIFPENSLESSTAEHLIKLGTLLVTIEDLRRQSEQLCLKNEDIMNQIGDEK